jgi:aspartate kinase
MKVMKFGGTSVGIPARMKEVVSLVTNQQEPVMLVLSALSGTTNALVSISEHIRNDEREAAKNDIDQLQLHYEGFIKTLLKKRETLKKARLLLEEHFEFFNITLKISYSDALYRDILSQGELLSTKLFSVLLTEQKKPHLLIPALSFMRLNENEEPDLPYITQQIKELVKANKDCPLFVTQGFICKNARGEVDNLKRGGSDYTASLVAAALKASVCEIWTDIDGMHNNDPRVVDKTRPVEQLSFDEAAELAYFGAKILHPASIWPAQQFNIPVKLLNTMAPGKKGTTITGKAIKNGIKAIAAKDGITVIRIKSTRMLLAYGFLRKIFAIFEKFETPIDMITTSEVAISLTIDNPHKLKNIIKELQPFSMVETENTKTIIAVVGHEIATDKALLTRLFNCTANIPVQMVSFGGSPHNISLLIPTKNKKETLQQLNDGLFHRSDVVQATNK